MRIDNLSVVLWEKDLTSIFKLSKYWWIFCFLGHLTRTFQSLKPRVTNNRLRWQYRQALCNRKINIQNDFIRYKPSDLILIDIDMKLIPFLNAIFLNIRSSKTTVRVSVCPPSVRNEFYIWLALPISPSIMDRFWCSRCLNDRVEVPDMIRLFAGGATTPLVVKIWTKQP